MVFLGAPTMQHGCLQADKPVVIGTALEQPAPAATADKASPGPESATGQHAENQKPNCGENVIEAHWPIPLACNQNQYRRQHPAAQARNRTKAQYGRHRHGGAVERVTVAWFGGFAHKVSKQQHWCRIGIITTCLRQRKPQTIQTKPE